MMICPVCKLEVPERPADLNMPHEATCKRNHDRHPGCPYQPVIDQCRGNWIAEVFTPAPPEEADALSKYID